MNEISFVGFIQSEDVKQQQYNIELLLKQKNDRYVRDILPLRIEDFEIKCLEWKDFKGKPIEDSEWIAHSYWGIFYNYQIVEEKRKIPIKIKQQSYFQQYDDQKLMEKQGQYHPLNLENENSTFSEKSQSNQPTTYNFILNQPASEQINQHINLRLLSVYKEKNQNVSKFARGQTKNSYSQKKETRIGQNESRSSSTKLKVKLSVKCTFSEKSWAKSCVNEYEDLLEHETGHYLIGCLCALEFKRQIEQLRLTKQENPSLQIKSIFQTIFRNFQKIEKDYDEETDHFDDQAMQKKWNHKIKEQLLLYEMYFCCN